MSIDNKVELLHRLVTNPRIESNIEEIRPMRYIGENLRGNTIGFSAFEAIPDLLYKEKPVYLITHFVRGL